MPPADSSGPQQPTANPRGRRENPGLHVVLAAYCVLAVWFRCRLRILLLYRRLALLLRWISRLRLWLGWRGIVIRVNYGDFLLGSGFF